jgi:hypothetical protein
MCLWFFLRQGGHKICCRRLCAHHVLQHIIALRISG